MMMNSLVQRPQEISECLCVCLLVMPMRCLLLSTSVVWFPYVVQTWKVCQGGCEAHLDAKPAQYCPRLALHSARGASHQLCYVGCGQKVLHNNIFLSIAESWDTQEDCGQLERPSFQVFWARSKPDALPVGNSFGNLHVVHTCTYVLCLPGIVLQIKLGVKLLKLVRGDLLDVIHVCETKLKQTNYLRSLISDLVKGTYTRVHAECQVAAQYSTNTYSAS